MERPTHCALGQTAHGGGQGRRRLGAHGSKQRWSEKEPWRGEPQLGFEQVHRMLTSKRKRKRKRERKKKKLPVSQRLDTFLTPTLCLDQGSWHFLKSSQRGRGGSSRKEKEEEKEKEQEGLNV